ncbi:MAG: sodium:solute symporter family protein [Eubacteriales bacterium]|nr:sodium:solute symporter family protein [Eubacteriales bacterium]
MLKYVVIYVGILLVIGIMDCFKVKNFDDFAVAGKRQSLVLVLLSLMATMVGASATIGIMGRVSSLGFPAFWWLAVGSVGLFLQSVFLSERIREYDADTLPDLVGKLVGKGGASIVAIIIVISWPGIVASQIVAMSSILAFVTGKANNKTLMLIVAIAVILYTIVGGQLSVIKTDALQFIIITVAFVATFIYLFFFAKGDTKVVTDNICLFNDKYTVKDLLIQLFIVGGTYLLGPDVISRNLVAKDGKTAKKSARIASAFLLLFSIMIVMIGMWILGNVSELDGQNPLLYIISDVLPMPIGVLMAVGLLSTLLSTADTCLVNLASILEHDVLKRNKVGELRVLAGIIGAVAVVIAFYKGDIIAQLTGAYSVYAPGIVCPLFVALLTAKKKKLYIPLWILAVVCGGLCGALNTYVWKDLSYLPITGMGISLVLAVLSYVFGKECNREGTV